MSLHHHARCTKEGRAIPDNVISQVDLPHRKSFSPDVVYIMRGRSRSMKAMDEAPVFAVEVRSEGDSGPRAEHMPAEKRADYFAAGTLVVWDVDTRSADVIRKYTAGSPNTPEVFRVGEIANAEPAVPGWRMAVDELFD